MHCPRKAGEQCSGGFDAVAAALLQETTFMSSGRADELFASEHVEQRLPASTLLRKCVVESGHPGKRCAIMDRRASTGPHSYFCMYRYDHEGEALKPIQDD